MAEPLINEENNVVTAPPLAESPSPSIQYYHEAAVECAVRKDVSLQSDFVENLDAGQLVHIVQKVGRRALIDFPLDGWVSMWNATGVIIKESNQVYKSQQEKTETACTEKERRILDHDLPLAGEVPGGVYKSHEVSVDASSPHSGKNVPLATLPPGVVEDLELVPDSTYISFVDRSAPKPRLRVFHGLQNDFEPKRDGSGKLRTSHARIFRAVTGLYPDADSHTCWFGWNVSPSGSLDLFSTALNTTQGWRGDEALDQEAEANLRDLISRENMILLVTAMDEKRGDGLPTNQNILLEGLNAFSRLC